MRCAAQSCCRREDTVRTVKIASLLLGVLVGTSLGQQSAHVAAVAQSPSVQAPMARMATPLPLAERLNESWRWRTIEGPDGVSRFSDVRPWKDGGLIAKDDRGLLAYDGHVWRREPGWEKFQHQELREIVPQRDGLIAITSRSIIAISGAGDMTTLRYVDNPQRITVPCRLADGSVLVGLERTILRIDATGLHEAFAAPDVPERLAGLFLDPEGALCAYTERDLIRRVGDSWEKAGAAPQLAAHQPRIACALSAGDLVYFLPMVIDKVTSGFSWDGTLVTELRGPDPPALVVTAMTTPEDDLIVALRGPLWRVYRDGAWTEAKLPGDRRDFVRSMCLTSEGRLAAVFASGDLAVCDLLSTCWEQHDPRDVGAGALVNALAPAAASGVWVGTNAGIARWDGARFTDVHVELPELGVRLDQVTTVCEDGRGRLWVGSGSGFRGAACLDNDRWTLYADADQDIGSRFVHAIRRDGDDLWFLLLGDSDKDWLAGGVVRLRGDTFTQFLTDAAGRPMPRCYDLLRRSDGTLVLGAVGGLMRLDGEGWTMAADGLPVDAQRNAFALRETRDGALLVGLGLEYSGVFRLDAGAWEELASENGRLAPAASFCETGDGRQWFASALGLFMTDGNAYHDVSSLLPARTMWPLLPDGERGLWIGMLGGGLARFCPGDELPPRTLPPDLEYGEDGEVVARWRGVDAWNATPADQLRFRVLLDGELLATSTPETWTTMPTRRLSLGMLGSGPHTLTISAVDCVGNVEPEPLRTEIPAASERGALRASSPAVVAVSLALLLALGWALMNWLNRRGERHQAQAEQAALNARLTALTRRMLSTQEDERQSLSRELHDNLGQICTALCIDIQRAARQEDAGRRSETLDHALGVARELLDRVRRMSSELRPLLLDDHGLQNAVSVALAEFTEVNGVDVQADLQFAGPEAPRDVAGHIYRILQEALTNVARHAAAQTVDVRLITSEQAITLTVSDDGHGFVPEALALPSRCGLLGMRERAELAGGSFDLKSSPHGGTSIHVSIPLKRSGAEGSNAAHSGNDSHG